jgi:guanine deaminase
VFGAHFARLLRLELHTTAQRTYDQRLALANSWHEQGLNRYAVIPRSALSWTDELLAPCAAPPAAVPGCWLKSHVTENTTEIATRCAICSGAATSAATTGTA